MRVFGARSIAMTGTEIFYNYICNIYTYADGTVMSQTQYTWKLTEGHLTQY